VSNFHAIPWKLRSHDYFSKFNDEVWNLNVRLRFWSILDIIHLSPFFLILLWVFVESIINQKIGLFNLFLHYFRLLNHIFAPNLNPESWEESRSVLRSRLADEFQKHLGVRSRIFLSHIRRATKGKAGYVNTHPFYRRFGQKTWIFAHNGTIDSGQLSFSSKEFSPIGETDSELVFCSLLSWLGNGGIQLTVNNGFTLLHEKLQEINQLGTLKLIFRDVKNLFVYHDRSGHLGLYCLLCQTPYIQSFQTTRPTPNSQFGGGHRSRWTRIHRGH